MRKITIISIAIAAFAALCFAQAYTPMSAESAATVTGNRTFTGTVIASGTGFIAATAQVDTNATTSVTTKTPEYVGQILVGATGSTSSVWVAKGVTTNDWVEVAGPE